MVRGGTCYFPTKRADPFSNIFFEGVIQTVPGLLRDLIKVVEISLYQINDERIFRLEMEIDAPRQYITRISYVF